MKTWTRLASLGLAVALGFSIGCDNPDSARPPGLVAVVDMIRLQQETGFAEVRAAEMKKVQEQWEKQFAAMQQAFSAKLQADSQALGQNPTSEQIAKFEAMRNRIGQSIEEAYNAYNAAMQQKEQELQLQFRQKYQEIIIGSATEKGLSVVIESGPWIAAASKDCDVTDDALAKIKSAGLTYSAGSGASVAPGVGAGGLPGMAPVPTTGFSGRSFDGTAPGTSPGLAPGTAPGLAPGMAPGMAPGGAPGVAPGTPPGMMPGVIPPTTAPSPTTPVEANPQTQPAPAP